MRQEYGTCRIVRQGDCVESRRRLLSPVPSSCILASVGKRLAPLAAKPAQKREAPAPVVASEPAKVAQRSPLGLPAYVRAMAGGAADATEQLGGLSQSGGDPLPVPTMSRLELLFGQSLAHVRVHDGPDAERAAASVDARAVTLGSHIYLGRGQLAHGPEAERLLAHEATHVVQHDRGSLAQPEGNGGVVLAHPDAETEHEAHAAEAKVAEIPTAPPIAPPQAPASSPKQGQHASANVFGDAGRWIGGKLDDIEQWGEDKLMALVEDIAPELAHLIEVGPLGYIEDRLVPAISGWVSSLTGGVGLGDIASQIGSSLSEAFALLQAAKNGDQAACDTLVKGIEAIRGLAQKFMDNPAIGALKSAVTAVSDVVGKVVKFVLGPAWDLLKKIVGPAWDAIKSVASTIQSLLQKVKDVAMRAFNWVARRLGFDSATGEGGLMDWLEKKAGEVWDKIKETLKPILGPLKVIAGVLLAFTGLPQIYLIVKYGPKIIEGIQWLWANRNNPDAVKSNPGLVGGSIFPRILGALQGFSSAVQSGATWLVGKVTDLASGALKLVGALTGIPLLSIAQSFVQTLADKANDLKGWAVEKFQAASAWVMGVYTKIAGFLHRYGKVLVQIALAMTNPGMIPIILAGEAWQWLPDCVKPPLIDLLLDAVLAILRGLPALPMLGVLWPLLKSGIIGFLEAFRGRDPATKIKVSNKLAKIISGGSTDFLIGFVKGFLKGVWDGIKMPFEAIWMVAKGIEKVGDFFAALGAEDKPRGGPAASPSHAQPPVPTGMVSHVEHSTPPAPAPKVGVPSVITPAQASGAVAGIAATLVRNKPRQPTRHEMIETPSPAAAPPAAAPPEPAPKGGVPPNEYAEVAAEARKMGSQLAGPAETVENGFWPAVQELFSGSGASMSLDDLIAKLEKVWEAAKSAIESLGGQLSNMITDFFAGDGAESEVGNAVGYLVGMFAFQALLDYLSAGTWTGAMGVLSSIAKFLNWPMEFLGEAMAALKSLGGFILDGIKSLGSMVTEAAGGALKEVIAAFGEIGTKLGEFAEELMAKVHGGGSAAEHEAAGVAEREAATAADKEGVAAAEKEGEQAAEKEAENAAEREGEETAEKEADEAAEKAEERAEAVEIAREIAAAEESGGVPAPMIALSLDGLETRYSWIHEFTSEGGDIYLIASKYFIKRVQPKTPKEGEPADAAAAEKAEAKAAEEGKAAEGETSEVPDPRDSKGAVDLKHYMPEQYEVVGEQRTIDVNSPRWRQQLKGFNPRDKQYLYAVRNAETGEVLKVGETESLSKRLADYRTASLTSAEHGGNVVVDVVEVKVPEGGSLTEAEASMRKDVLEDARGANKLPQAEESEVLPWDNSSNRLGRGGPGTPGADSYDLKTKGLKWDGDQIARMTEEQIADVKAAVIRKLGTPPADLAEQVAAKGKEAVKRIYKLRTRDLDFWLMILKL